ncbi:MAG: polysaccharide deacetylase family protein [Armatimonadota bacterium]|nr:polysaccharide deacetylase family protein [Armatimonadota bacterium]
MLSELIESPYPNGCRGAVSLTFDDGLDCHLDIAVPALNDRGLPSTFYVVAREMTAGADDWKDRAAKWKEVVRQGHEIGNHSVSHI